MVQPFQRSRRKLPGTWELVETPQAAWPASTPRGQPLVEEACWRGGSRTGGVHCAEAGSRLWRGEQPCDFRLDYPTGALYVEVKSVTLGFEGTPVAAFPDAVTTRGAKHLRELAHLAREGTRCRAAVLREPLGIDAVRPAREIDPHYARPWRMPTRPGWRYWPTARELSPEGMVLTRPP